MENEKPSERGIAFRRDTTDDYVRGKSYFLGIGIDEYQHFRRLYNAVADMEEMAKLLFEEFVFEPPDNLVNQFATKEAIVNKLAYYSKVLEPSDKLLIYFSGHSIKDGPDPEHDAVFWAPVNACRENHDSIIVGDLVKYYFKSCRAKHIFLISDSCFSGGFLKGRGKPDNERKNKDWAKKLEMVTSRWALFSGREMETVSDGIPGKHSPFANAIFDFFRLEQDAPFINVGYLVHQVSQIADEYENGQLASGEPIPDCGHRQSGQYIFWRRNEKKQWIKTPVIDKKNTIVIRPLPNYSIDTSELPSFPPITLKILTIMEESLRRSCQLMLERLNIPICDNKWALRSVCESKIHCVVELLEDMEKFLKIFTKHSVASTKVYQALKKIRQDFLQHFEANELEFMREVGSSDFIVAIHTPLSNAGFQLSACENILKEASVENDNVRNDVDSRLAEIIVALKLLYLIFKNIHQATDLYDIPPYLSN